jgi:hypothetical protein
VNLTGAADLAVIGAILTAIITAVTLAVKAGPAWNTSLIKNARDEVLALSVSLEKERARADRAETESREQARRANRAEDEVSRLREQMSHGDRTPFDEGSGHE